MITEQRIQELKEEFPQAEISIWNTYDQSGNETVKIVIEYARN